MNDRLDRWAGWGLWMLPLWAGLLLLSTQTRQPSYQTDFPGYASYITTPQFLLSHIVASIVGAGFGTLGFIALFVRLVRQRLPLMALWALVALVVGNTMITSVFGVAAFAQPAIGRAYFAGDEAEAVAINSDIYGPALLATVLPGILLFTVGVALFGVAVARSGSLPRVAGIVLAVSVPLFSIVGFVLADVFQTVGSALMLASTGWIAIAGQRRTSTPS